MTHYTMTVTEDAFRVMALACEYLYSVNTQTRDGLIAHQTELAIKRILLPEHTPEPRRLTNEPMPEIEVKA